MKNLSTLKAHVSAPDSHNCAFVRCTRFAGNTPTSYEARRAAPARPAASTNKISKEK